MDAEKLITPEQHQAATTTGRGSYQSDAVQRYEKQCGKRFVEDHDLAQLAEYWLKMYFKLEMAYFLDCSMGGTERLWHRKSYEGFEDIDKLLGRTALLSAIRQVDSTMEYDYGGYWDVYKGVAPCAYFGLSPSRDLEGAKAAWLYQIAELPLRGEGIWWDVPSDNTVLWCTLDLLAQCYDSLEEEACGTRLNGSPQAKGAGIQFSVGTSFSQATQIVRIYCEELKREAMELSEPDVRFALRLRSKAARAAKASEQEAPG